MQASLETDGQYFQKDMLSSIRHQKKPPLKAVPTRCIVQPRMGRFESFSNAKKILISLDPPQATVIYEQSSGGEKEKLIIHLLLRSILLLHRNLLRLRLLLIQILRQPSQPITSNHQSRRHNRLPTSNVPIPTTLLVLVPKSLKHIIFALARHPQGQEGEIENGALDFLGVLLDDGEGAVDFLQAAVGELVGFLDVGSDVAVGALGVGDDGRDDFVVAFVGEGDAFFAVGVVFDGV